MLPGIRKKHLHRFIDSGTKSHQQTKEQRINTIDVIKIDHLQLLTTESPKQISTHKQGKDNDKIRSMRIAE